MTSQSLSPSEFNPNYKTYIDQCEGVGLLDGLQGGKENTVSFFKSIPSNKLEFAYAPGKWTPKQVLLHIIDTERVFAYRALQFSRASNVVLEGFDQDEFASNANASSRTLESLIDEYAAVRQASIEFVKNCSKEAMARMGEASKSPLSVRAAFFITCGHEIHHCNVIQERYL